MRRAARGRPFSYLLLRPLLVLVGDRVQGVDDALAEEVVVARAALARRRREREARALCHGARGRARLVVRRSLEDRLDRRRRHVRLVLVVPREVAVLADDQRGAT